MPVLYYGLLKPLIKECIKEVIFEIGTLSTIISEVLKGTQGLNVIRERKETKRQNSHENEERKKKRLRKCDRRRLISTVPTLTAIEIYISIELE